MKEMSSGRIHLPACTTMVVGKNASSEGSVIIAHSDDDVADERAIYVPRRTWDLTNPQEAFRNVYYDNASLGPNLAYNSTDIRRYIGKDRGPGYDTSEKEGYADSRPLGRIPQVSQTYSYFDSNYGIMNECSLMIGECTCGAKVHPQPGKDKRIFYSAELSRVALERCKTAIEAINLMASLIKDYGYYGTGETLLVGDSDEAWVMEMCGYDLNGTDGLWVAQRVPDDQFFVAANEFRIRDIIESKAAGPINGLYYQSDDPDNTILYSANLFEVCRNLGWIEADATELDWLPTVSHGEYSHPYYSLRRVWRAFSKAAPLLHLPAKAQDGFTRNYPFSIIPGKKLSVLDVAAIYRDHYEGTEFDLTLGIGAGPFGNPVRYEGNPDQGDSFNLNTYKPEGAWERPLSIYRCGMFWINQAKKTDDQIIGVSWIGLDRPVANCLMPFYTQTDSLPEALQTMNLLEFQFMGLSAWWAFNFVANYTNLNYSYMMKELVALQGRLEASAYKVIDQALTTGDTANLSQFCNQNTQEVVDEWWQLANKLIVLYNDGCLTRGPNNIMEKIDYPKKWLQATGYYNGPVEY